MAKASTCTARPWWPWSIPSHSSLCNTTLTGPHSTHCRGQQWCGRHAIVLQDGQVLAALPSCSPWTPATSQYLVAQGKAPRPSPHATRLPLLGHTLALLVPPLHTPSLLGPPPWVASAALTALAPASASSSNSWSLFLSLAGPPAHQVPLSHIHSASQAKLHEELQHNTHRVYQCEQQAFQSFCNCYHLTAFLDSEDTLMVFVTYLDEHLQWCYTMVHHYLAVIHLVHIALGLSNPLQDCPHLQQLPSRHYQTSCAEPGLCTASNSPKTGCYGQPSPWVTMACSAVEN